MTRGRLTTGRAAKLCGVTPDAVLKWIKAGRLRARRTPGGHYRLDPRDLTPFRADAPGREFRYCWEFNSVSGRMPDECKRCLVYRARAKRCYELVELGRESGHAKLYCSKTCARCDYFRLVKEQAPNVLVVSRDLTAESGPRSPTLEALFTLSFTDSEYELSALIDTFRPDFAVIDCGLGVKRALGIADALLLDTRVELVRIILAARPAEFPGDCDSRIVARIPRPPRLRHIADCLDRLGENA